MNCIWLLLILFCSGCNNNRGSDWSDNGCGCDNCSDRNNRNAYRRSNDYDDCDNCNDCDTYERTSNTREAACDAAYDNNRDRNDDDCGCRRTYNFPSYPVLDSCD